jgi:putative nucleotidyltransferase with HDIG domain
MIFQVAYKGSDKDPEQNSSKTPSLDEGDDFETGSLPSQPNDDFKYFNKNAITMPLTSSPMTHDQNIKRSYVLGGLMALTKQNSSFNKEDARLIQILANQTSTFIQVAEMYESAGELYLGAIKALVAAIDAKDPYTQGHSHRVSDYSVLISKEIGLDEELVNDIRIGSLLHDIGKIGIPDHVLLKNGKLTSEEFDIIKKHPKTGVNILSQVQLLEPMLPAILEHHERLDGSGYPDKLMGSNISLMGRIVAVADVFDAMTSHRPYRPALSFLEVLEYLEKNSSKLFDPICVNAMKNIIQRSNG